ncbi:hypothetical protein V6C27_06015 [Peptococcaceae bacterium 1198_IL3148]
MLDKLRKLFNLSGGSDQWVDANEIFDIFSGKVEFPDTNQKIHKVDRGEREGALCFLYNLVYNMDLRLSLEDICTLIAVYGNNLRTIANKKKFISGDNKLDVNSSERKLIAYLLEEIILPNYKFIKSINDKRKQFDHLMEIRKWTSMVYSTIHNKVLKTKPEKFNITACVDEAFITRIVIVTEESDQKDEMTFTWHRINSDDVDDKLAEISKTLVKQKQGRSVQNKNEAKYQDYYDKAQEYVTLGKYQQAEKLFNRIINSKETFGFTSGAYVTLATIKLNNSNINNQKNKGKIVKLLNKALEINPNNTIAPAVFVTLHVVTGAYDQARHWLGKCHHERTREQLEQNLEQLNQFFQFAFLPGLANDVVNNDDAIGFFEDALALFPDNIFVRLNAAKLYANREEEYLLKAYDLYKSLINDLPDFYLIYQLMGDLCGAGYLERPKEQEQYYLKALELLEEDNLDAELQQQHRFVIEGNLISAWLMLEKYQQVLDLTTERIKKNPNNTDIHNHAAALYFLERYQESIAYCQRELFVGEDESTYILLGKNFYALEDFPNAITSLRKALAFIDQEPLATYYQDENDRGLLSYAKDSWQRNKLKEIYTLLLISYYRQEDYLNAKAIWKLANSIYKQDETIKAWGHTIDSMLTTKNQLELANERYEKIKMELAQEKEMQASKQQIVRQWALELMKIQGEGSATESIDDADWITFEQQINAIIIKMRKEVKDKQGYGASKKAFTQKYPKLAHKSIDFLTTAEYLYQHNKDAQIDFAPIMVEFCKVIENELRIVLKQNKLTLGQAIYFIENNKVYPLFSRIASFKEIYLCRNGSAHTGVSTREKVERIRKLITGPDGALNIICEMKI